jgi:flagellar biosynthetic protein FlhB
MAESGGGEKTEKASPKKRQDERKKGNILMSKDVATVISLVLSFFILRFFVPNFVLGIQEHYKTQMLRIRDFESIDVTLANSFLREFLMLFGTTIFPAIVLIATVAIIATGFQTKFLWATDKLKFKFERINPIKGFKKLFSLRSLVELFKSLIKISVLTWVLYGNVQRVIADLPGMMDWDVMSAFSYTGHQIFSLIISVGIAFSVVAALDFLYQRWEYEKNIKMSKQEVKDEYKQMEGNPEIKGARRQKQREYAMGRMMQAVKEADVVVRNPTHYAVALKYKLEVDAAPTVLAKGTDNIALKIIEEAESYDISCVENRSLARGLYQAAEIDAVIPSEFFQPVAELLALLYTEKAKEKR